MVTAAVVDEVRYPVGEFRIDPGVTPQKRKMWNEQMAEAPAKLRTALLGLSEEQLDTRYRKDGWTLRQVVHHLADAQLNGFTRTFRHPQRGELRIDDAIQLYAWHGVHHTAHISKLRERKAW